MSKAQDMFSSLIEIAEDSKMDLSVSEKYHSIGDSLGAMWSKFDGDFHNLYVQIRTHNQCPVVTRLGNQGGHRFRLDGEDQDKVTPFWRMENSHGTMAIQTANPTRQCSPYEFVEYNHHGDRVWSCELPTLPPPDKYRLKELVETSVGTFGSIELTRYTGNEQLAVIGWYFGAESPADKATISTNMVEHSTLLPPGHFFFRDWSENAPLAVKLMEKDIVLITGKTSETGYVASHIACLNWSKFEDIPAIECKGDDCGF